MKKLPYGTVLVLLGLGAAAVQAQSTSKFCNNALIVGVYGFTIEGTRFPTPPPPPPATPPPSGPQVGVAMTEFFPDGTLKQVDSVVIGGHVSSDFINAPAAAVATGTYKVNPDCTGTFTLNFVDGRPTITTNFVVVSNGNEIDTVEMNNTGVIATGSIGKRRFVGIW